jgi:hypothetical protein
MVWLVFAAFVVLIAVVFAAMFSDFWGQGGRDE